MFDVAFANGDAAVCDGNDVVDTVTVSVNDADAASDVLRGTSLWQMVRSMGAVTRFVNNLNG